MNNNLTKTFRWVVVIFAVCALIMLVGCKSNGLSGSLPQGAADVALNKAREVAREFGCGGKPEATKDFNIAEAKEGELSDANRANGIEKRWIVTVNWIYKCEDGWHDMGFPIVVEMVAGGSWRLQPR